MPVTDQDLLKNSPFKVSPAPQYCTSETLLGSLYRAIGYKSVGEKNVYSNGKNFYGFMHGYFNKKTNQNVDTDSTILKEPEKLNTLLEEVFISPKSENGVESQKKTYVDTPLTPAFAIFTGTNSYSETAHPWNPGELVKSMIIAGSASFAEAKELWFKLFDALNVNVDDSGEDLSARFIEKELRNWFSLLKIKQNKGDDFFPSFTYNDLDEKDQSYSLKLSQEDFEKINFPAKQFTKDLNVLINLKKKLSRKLWISLFESVLRLSTVSHFLWICNIRYKIYECMIRNLDSQVCDSLEIIHDVISFYGEEFSFADANGKAVLGDIKDRIKNSILFSYYLEFWCNKLINAKLLNIEDSNIETIEDLNKIFTLLFSNRDILYTQANKEELQRWKIQNKKVINCTNGIGKLRFEFVRHILGKKMPKEERMKGYDQSYIINKKGPYNSSPWIISFGDTSILAFVYCALGEQQTSKPILEFEKYLKTYGITFDSNNKLYRQLSEQLRLNSLVLDTPDASSIMNLIPPFSV